MIEKDIQRLFSKYIETHRPKGTRVYELKLCKGGTLPFKAIRSHQVSALSNAATNTGLYHKIADMTFGRSGYFGNANKKPFDCLFISKAKAYIVVCFYKPRKPKEVYLINILDWNNYREGHPEKKSMSKDVCKFVAEEVIVLRGN